MRIDILAVKNPHGGGKRKLSSIETNCLLKKSVVKIPKCSENLCCARAIVVALAFLEKHTQYKTIRDGRWDKQKTLAKQLQLDAGVPEGSCGYTEIRKFEDHLDVQIHDVSANEFNKVFIIIIIKFSNMALFYHFF